MFERIKAIVEDDSAFYGLLLVLIGMSAFGLGRWSAAEHAPQTHSAASIVVTEAAAEDVASPGTDSAEADEPAPATAADGKYVGSRNSDKYHLPWCPGAQRIKDENKVWFENKAAAEAQGYAPAANCPGL